MKSLLLALTFAAAVFHPSTVVATPSTHQIDAYFRPYATTNNLSGSVLITRGKTIIFKQSYGYADQAKRIANRPETRVHIASLSILFTTTAVLRLIDQRKLSFGTHVSEIIAGVPNGNKITIRNLLLQNSGMPDSNDDLPNYDDLLKIHQTPQSLVDVIKQLPPLHEPGGETQREEHSGQNLLALIIERKTGLPFARAMDRLVFGPLGMGNSGIDDDSPIAEPAARGYEVTGTFGLKLAPQIHWSAKAGNGSAYSTPADIWRWLRSIVHGRLLSKRSRQSLLDTQEGFGWWQVKSESLGESVYQSNGRGPGFSSFFEYLPKEDVAVILLTNLEHDANPEIVREAAKMVMGKPYNAFNYTPTPLAVAGRPSGDFIFGPDFYRKNAMLRLVSGMNGITLYWPERPVAPLLPLGKDRFMDRYYWTPVRIIRGADGDPVEMEYGRFRGIRRDLPGLTATSRRKGGQWAERTASLLLKQRNCQKKRARCLREAPGPS